MTPTEGRDSLRCMVTEDGETIIVRRYSGIGAARVAITPEATTLARVKGYQAKELVGAIVQGDQEVVALVETGSLLAALLPLSNADKLVIDGREVAIKAVDHKSRSLKGDVFGLNITAAG
jgi:hypothetical protein